jgi:hypothetical protein
MAPKPSKIRRLIAHGRSRSKMERYLLKIRAFRRHYTLAPINLLVYNHL